MTRILELSDHDTDTLANTISSAEIRHTHQAQRRDLPAAARIEHAQSAERLSRIRMALTGAPVDNGPHG